MSRVKPAHSHAFPNCSLFKDLPRPGPLNFAVSGGRIAGGSIPRSREGSSLGPPRILHKSPLPLFFRPFLNSTPHQNSDAPPSPGPLETPPPANPTTAAHTRGLPPRPTPPPSALRNAAPTARHAPRIVEPVVKTSSMTIKSRAVPPRVQSPSNHPSVGQNALATFLARSLIGIST